MERSQTVIAKRKGAMVTPSKSKTKVRSKSANLISVRALGYEKLGKRTVYKFLICGYES